MRAFFPIFVLLMISAVYAMVPFQHTSTVTAHFNDSSTIKINGQAFLKMNKTIIHHYENGVLTEKNYSLR